MCIAILAYSLSVCLIAINLSLVEKEFHLSMHQVAFLAGLANLAHP